MKIRNHFSVFILIVLCLSCGNRNEPIDQDHEVPEEVSVYPEIVDTFQFDSKNKLAEDFLRSNYRPLYIGVDTSSIVVDYNIQKFYTDPASLIAWVNDTSQKYTSWEKYWKKYQVYYDEYPLKEYIHWDEAELQVMIDTSVIISNTGYYKTYGKEEIYPAFPVIIKNKDTNSVIIGYGTHLPLTLEAKSIKGEWFQMEYPYYYPCGNGIPHLILPEKNMIISSLPITQGEDKVEFRLKLGNNYSNVIHGNITIANKPAIITP